MSKAGKEKLTTVVAVALPLAVIAVVAVMIIMLSKSGGNNAGAGAAANETEKAIPADPERMKYASETNYTGEMGKYPELYSTPFKKTEAYISNKEFTKQKGFLIPILKDEAKVFFDKMLNTDVKTMAENKTLFMTELLQMYDRNSKRMTEEKGEDGIPLFEKNTDRIHRIVDYMIDNNVKMDASFVTDDSLVYQDLYYFVRGELIFTVYNSDDRDSEYEKGKEYHVPLDVAFTDSKEEPGQILVHSFADLDDNSYYFPRFTSEGDGMDMLIINEYKEGK